MQRAITLSKRGFPAPNPHVGCVIVNDDKIVGEGFHAYAGGPHAERVALAVAGEKARGAHAYVTLEPCNHHGRTPPCVDGLLEAGISKVFVSVADPNPTAAGGANRLRAKGIPVEIGLLETLAREANPYFFHALKTQRPWVSLKAGISLDGRIALPDSQSKWITSPDARKVAHRLRAELGAVLVGYQTVVADDPSLTAHFPGVVNQPLRVVLDPRSELSAHHKVFNNEAPTEHVTGPVNLAQLLSELYQRGTIGLLVEGGAKTHAQFLKAGFVDAIELFVSAKILGQGLTWVEGSLQDSIPDAAEFEFWKAKSVGPDIWLSLRRKR